MLDSRYLRPSTLESSAPRQFQRQRPKLLPAACRLALSLPLVNSLGRGSKNMTCICGETYSYNTLHVSGHVYRMYLVLPHEHGACRVEDTRVAKI